MAWWSVFKFWTRLFAFYFAQIPLGKTWIHLSLIQLCWGHIEPVAKGLDKSIQARCYFDTPSLSIVMDYSHSCMNCPHRRTWRQSYSSARTMFLSVVENTARVASLIEDDMAVEFDLLRWMIHEIAHDKFGYLKEYSRWDLKLIRH